MKKAEIRWHGRRCRRESQIQAPSRSGLGDEVYSTFHMRIGDEGTMRHSQKPRSRLKDSQHPGETFETPLSELTASVAAQIRSRLVDDVRGEILSALEEVVAGLDAGLAGRREARTPLSPLRQPPEDVRSDNENLAGESLDPWIIPTLGDDSNPRYQD